MRRLSLVCCFIFACTGGAFAQSFPGGPITIVVPLAPGDAADISARSMAEEMSRRLGVPVLAVNRPGAGGAVGAASVVQAKKRSESVV